MAAKSDDHKIKLTGPGLSLDRSISQDIATQIVNLVMTGVATGGAPPGAAIAQAAGATINASGAPTPRQFLAQKRPDSNYERVACLAFYLTNHGGTPKFKTEHITKLATDAAVHFSNPALFVKHATNTYHYLAPAGGGQKQITTLGEAVVEALPDREKVKAAIADYKPKRRKSRKAKR